jgi:hypothetical protein
MELYNFFNSKNNTMSEYMSSIKSVKKLSDKIHLDYKFVVTNFSYNNTLNNLFFCLMYNEVIQGYASVFDELLEGYDQYDRSIINLNTKPIEDQRNNLIEYINDDNFDLQFSKKKLIQLISNNQYNHEIILVLSHIYKVNIFIFYKNINIFKSYYNEDKFNKMFPIIFLQYCTDIYSNGDTLQVMSINHLQNKFIFKWEDVKNIINENISNIYSIGIEENKSFIIDENDGPSTQMNINVSKKLHKNSDTISISNYLVDNDKIGDEELFNKIMKQ